MIPAQAKAITIWQPYASLIVMGVKEFETRTWTTKHTGLLVIHAAKRQMKGRELKLHQWLMQTLPVEQQIQLRNLPFGAAVGTVEVVECKHQNNYRGFISETERRVGDWSTADYAWKLAKPYKFNSPIYAKGSQGLWNWKYTIQSS